MRRQWTYVRYLLVGILTGLVGWAALMLYVFALGSAVGQIEVRGKCSSPYRPVPGGPFHRYRTILTDPTT